MGISGSKLTSKTNSRRQLYHNDKPSCPGKPTLKANSENLHHPDIITIQWAPAASNGGSNIIGGSNVIGYIVEHKRTGSPYWVRATPVRVHYPELTLSGLEPGWRYQFRVFAENAYGLSESSPVSEPLAISSDRMVAIAPCFTQELRDVYALENEKVEFHVKYQGVPTSKIVWYKNGAEIYSNRCLKITTNEHDSSLIFHEAILTYQGEIKCTATNRAGHAVTKATLVIRAPPSLRFPKQYEEGLIFQKGDTIKLKVSVVGYPTPTVYWFHNGTRLNADKRYEINFTVDNVSTFKLKDARRTDRGEYQVHAVNDIGEDVASILVTVANKPQAPKNITVTGKTTNAVALSWTQPEDDGGCKIGSYIVEYYKVGWNIWLKAVSSRQLTVIVSDLIEGSQYKFRVKAENPYGISEPSPESEVVIVGHYDEHDDNESNSSRSTNVSTTVLEDVTTTTTTTTPNIRNASTKITPEKPKRKKPADAARPEFCGIIDKDIHRENETNSRLRSNLRQWVSTDRGLDINQKNRFDSIISNADSELMLILLPDRKGRPKKSDAQYDKDEIDKSPGKSNRSVDTAGYFDNTSVPPPMSLSAPELGSDELALCGQPLQRNCVSSTEVLKERSAARVYKSMRQSPQKYLPDTVITTRSVINDKRKNFTNDRYYPDDDIRNKRNDDDDDDVHDDDKYNSNNNNNNNNRINNKDILLNSNRFIGKQLSYKEDIHRTAADDDDSLKEEDQFTNNTFEVGRHYSDGNFRQDDEDDSINGGSSDSSNVDSNDCNDDRKRFYEFANDSAEIADENDNADNEQIDNEDTDNEDDNNKSNNDDNMYEVDTYHPEQMSSLAFEEATRYPYNRNSAYYRDPSLLTVAIDTININSTNAANNVANSTIGKTYLKPILKHQPCYRSNDDDNNVAKRRTDINKNDAGGIPSKKVRIEEPKRSALSNEDEFIISKNDENDDDDSDNDNDDSNERLSTLVAVDHYGDIVREFSAVQKPNARVYLTYDELKAAAVAQQTTKQIRSNGILTSDLNVRPNASTVRSSLIHDDRLANKTDNDNSGAFKVRRKMRFLFDFSLDFIMFCLACWLYCFDNYVLAIPIIVLLVSRQAYDKFTSSNVVVRMLRIRKKERTQSE